jgi:sugar lactone lactonase YvrE
MGSKTLEAEVVHAAGAQLGEGPSWDPARRRLVWVDIPAGLVHLLDPASGDDRQLGVGQPVGAAVPAARGGGLVLAVRDGFARFGAGRRPELAFDLSSPGLRMNDGKCAPDGSFWAGTMREGATADAISDGEAPAEGTLYRLAPDWAGVEAALGGLGISNGLAWSADGRRMYFIDTAARRVDAFDAEPGTAHLANRRPVVEVPPRRGNPDGMAIDDEGCLWVALAHAGRVQRYRPDGTPDTAVEVPVPQVTSCCFGGDRGDVLFVTTGRRGADPADPLAGGVFACTPGVGGPPAAFYDGEAP